MDPKLVIAFVLLDVAVVVAVARLAGSLCRRLGQPAVIGEIAAGIALGPSLLGLLPGHLDTALFPGQVRGILAAIAQLGLVLFMLIVGLEIDMSLIRGRGRAAGVIATGSMALPFALGCGLAVLLHPLHDTVGGRPVPKIAFVLFLGVAMSITALPVLARVLAERGMQRTPIGVLALACAVLNDVLGWSLLAVVVAVAAGGDPAGVAHILALTIAFAMLAVLVLRPLLARMVGWYERVGRLTPDMLAVVLVGVLASAFVTEIIGVQALFGAFLFGAVMPRRGAAGLLREILERIEQVSTLLLLPVFFVVAGLQVNIAAFGRAGLWQLSLIMLAAVTGKVLGGLLTARSQRMTRRASTTIGVLMNTRGLTEIVILQIGVQLEILDSAMFTLMVIMALLTTLMTGPLLRVIYPARILLRELAAADRSAAGEVDAYTVVAAVPPDRASEFVELARQLAGHESPARVVLCRLLPAPTPLELASGIGSDLAVIATTGEQLRQLARGLDSDKRIRCSVIVRFSADPIGDLAALADTLDADVVVAGAEPSTGADEPPRWDAPVPCPANAAGVRIRLGSQATHQGQVLTLLDGEAGGRTTLRLGAQVALSRRSELAVGVNGGRRAARQVSNAVESLRGRGLTVHAANRNSDGPPDLLVTTTGAKHPTGFDEGVTVCSVQPDQTDRDDELNQTIARISLDGTGAPTPAR